jgi:MSHA type pilus biogenesis protein MshL
MDKQRIVTQSKKRAMSMKQLQSLITLCAAGVFFLLLAGCYAPRADRLQSKLGYAQLQEQMVKEQQKFLKARDRAMESLERHAEARPVLVPFAPVFDPLDEILVSITVHDETLHNILFVVARNAGLNLVIDPEISLDHRITVSFEHAPSSVVIDKLLSAYDLYWRVENNILSVHRFEERIFNLGFLNTQIVATVDSGGDIFGAAGNGAGLTGNFTVTSEIPAPESIYALLKQNVEDILEEGYYTLNMTAGTLFVRTTPGNMRAIARMVEELRSKLSRQVIIDAQIMEISLHDTFRLGVDWNFVIHRITAAGNILRYGLGMFPGTAGFGTFGDPADPGPSPIIIGPELGGTLDPGGIVGDDARFVATLDALQIFGGVKNLSNPHIRTRHGHPALITSGSTQHYLREVSRVVDPETGEVTYVTVTDTAFEGVMLGVIPHINEDNTADLAIFPITSEVDLTHTVELGEIRLVMPRVDVRNVNTNVRVRHDDMIILGGMIDKASSRVDRQTPGLGEMPGLGWLFKNRADAEQVRELVVVMRIRIV